MPRIHRSSRSGRPAWLAAVLLGLPVAASADALENAYFVCDVFEKTGVSTDCDVSSVNSTVDVVVEATPAEAANVCTVIVQRMVEKRRSFGARWKLRIFAPDRADEPIAACALR